MSAISDHDLERLASLMMYGDDSDLWEIVRLLKMDDDDGSIANQRVGGLGLASGPDVTMGNLPVTR
jgi:hypothetical protein